jgi:hypothetical protein
MGLLKTTIDKLDRPAILIGNGINLCSNLFKSWDDLLKKCASVEFKSDGLTNTEIYDFIELKTGDRNNLKSKIAKSFKSQETSAIHKSFIDLVIERDCPVLTTNFDLTLENVFFFFIR